MNESERELALDINTLLMAYHTEDSRALKSIINDSNQPVDLMLGGISVLKAMVDELIEFLSDNLEGVEVDFEAMIRARGEVIIEDGFTEE